MTKGAINNNNNNNNNKTNIQKKNKCTNVYK